jgi:cytochrome P450
MSRPESLIARIAAAQGSGGDQLKAAELLEEVSELLTAGFETTRDALTWALYLLARHPAYAARLRKQAHALGQRPLNAGDLPNLFYAEWFFSEALRLYPPAWMFIRIAIGDDELPTGVSVSAGTKILFCQYTAHRNPKYFPDPERFDPERFRPEAAQARPRFSYFPFGAGPRVCVAEPLARLEGVLVLASVARRFCLEPLPDQNIRPVGAITLRPSAPILVRTSAAPA